MLETKKLITSPVIAGIDQQDFKEIQLVEGSYPNLIGLQQRIPGKSLVSTKVGPIGSIYVFYMVYGRHYTLIDFGTGIEITPVIVPPITLPGLPPAQRKWFDTFKDYPDHFVSKLWGSGDWIGPSAICETIISGKIDPYNLQGFIPPPPAGPGTTPGPSGGSDIPPGGGPGFDYPPGWEVDVILYHNIGTYDVGCIGQGTFPVTSTDNLQYIDPPGYAPLSILYATDIAPGQIAEYHGVRVGRGTNTLGLVQSECHIDLSPLPARIEWYVYADGSYGIIS